MYDKKTKESHILNRCVIDISKIVKYLRKYERLDCSVMK